MEYREHRPAARLARWVACYWTLRCNALADAPPQGVLPDGCPEVVFNFADPFRRHEPGGRSYLQPRSLLVGQMRGHITIEATGRVDLLGVRFHPHGTSALLRVPFGELADRIEDLGDVAGPAASALFEPLGNMADPAERVRALDAALCGLLRARGGSTRTAEAVRLIRAGGGNTAIDRVARLSGCSPRQLERDFHRDVGLSPKMLSRLTRLQAVVRRSAQRRAGGWAAVAITCGYADQAHFIREFRAFSGQTPSSFFAGEQQLAEFFAGADERVPAVNQSAR